FFQAEDGIRDRNVTGVQTCALPIFAQTYPDKQIYTTGHSKGGNFAAYAISAVSLKIQDQIIKAYSFDGPGFMKETYDQLEFQRASPKMITYVPEGSIFGMMLDQSERV